MWDYNCFSYGQDKLFSIKWFIYAKIEEGIEKLKKMMKFWRSEKKWDQELKIFVAFSFFKRTMLVDEPTLCFPNQWTGLLVPSDQDLRWFPKPVWGALSPASSCPACSCARLVDNGLVWGCSLQRKRMVIIFNINGENIKSISWSKVWQ